jgi:hypothetical protein
VKVCVYTALFGDHLSLTPPLKLSSTGVDLICFSDRACQSSVRDWRQRRRAFATPRMDSKWYRMNSDLVLPEYDVTIWVDASFQLGDVDQFAAACLSDLGDSYTALFRHPERTDIYSEAKASLRVWDKKYENQPLLEQVDHYKRCGLPEAHSLWAGGIQIRLNHSDRVAELNRRWFAECVRWSEQDQLSLPYVLWEMGATDLVVPLSGNVYRGPHHEWTRGSDQ